MRGGWRAWLGLAVALMLVAGESGMAWAQAHPGVVKRATALQRSDIRLRDEVVVFETAARQSRDGAEWIVPVHVWVYQPERSRVRLGVAEKLIAPALGVPVPAAKRQVFEERANLLFSDNERRRRVVVLVAGGKFVLPATGPNGHAEGELRLARPVGDAAARAGLLDISVVLPAGDERVRRGRAHLIGPTGLSVISDIDDTIKMTHVTDRRRMIEATFLDPFTAVPGMGDLYASWSAARDQPDKVDAFHLVSSSPWHLYEPLRGMLQSSGFPPATLALKTIRLKDRTIANLFKPGTETKPPQIEALLAAYPQRSFILVGDNGEEDPEAYGMIARKYPARIRAIYIRVLPEKPEATADPRYAKAFKDVPMERWRLFREPSEIRRLP